MSPVPEEFWQSIRSCRLCEQEGLLPKAHPVFSPVYPAAWLLIGQAPGQVEEETGRPFSGRAGQQLFRWLATLGWEEEAFRARVYMTAIMRCFPGKNPSGPRGSPGDRPPSSREQALCRPHLESELAFINPRLLILVGGLAIATFLGTAPLEARVGRLFKQDGRFLLPLPHPSGASRWLNLPANRERLVAALRLLEECGDAGDR